VLGLANGGDGDALAPAISETVFAHEPANGVTENCVERVFFSGRGRVVVRGSADAGDQANATLSCVLEISGREEKALGSATPVPALRGHL